MQRIPMCAVAALLVASAIAQQPEVGSPAPAITAARWLNWTGDAPTVQSLAGRAVLLEFWGTWCGPCVRAMPEIQKLHARYRNQGLTVLAVSYEDPAVLEPFLKEHGYTMPVAADTAKAMVAAYGVRSWPTTFVLGKDGKVAHVGSPYDAEAAVEAALGLEAGPAALLDAWLATLGAKDQDAQRAALQRLVDKAPHDFDLQAWARAHLPPETAQPGDASGRTAAPAAATKRGEARPTLANVVAAWHGAADARTALLHHLAIADTTAFDLAAFARTRFGEAFPFDGTELAKLLDDQEFDAIITALRDRAPAASVRDAAAKHEGLQAYCRREEPGARRLARKGLMAQRYLFANALPADEATNGRFFRELSISGVQTSEDRKQILGILLGGSILKRADAEHYVQDQLTRALLMADLAAGHAPQLADLGERLATERAAVVADLVERYGEPKPVETK